jgi:hypothetical protein
MDYSNILINIENINNNIINYNIKNIFKNNNNVFINLNDYIKTYPFDVSKHLIIDDNGIIYNNSNNNTIVGFKSKMTNDITWL